MKLGEFLGLDKFKILILIIFFAIQALAFRVYEANPVETNPIVVLIYALNYPGMIVTYYMYYIHPYLRFLGIPVNALYWYLLACVIVFIVKKFGKKKTSPSE